ncbi:4835_t:CDS:2, partial [Entrophospora sp. SA101]
MNSPNYDENLQSWIKKFKLQYGLVIDERGVKEGDFQSFKFSTEINKINPTNSIKTKLTITNSLLKSYLLKSDIDDINNRMIKFFNQEVPFIDLKVKDSWSLEPEQKVKQTIHYEISSEQIELVFENFIPSNELIEVVRKALDTENPYHELEIIFNEYGHLLCKKVILGGKLSRLWYLNENLLPEKTIEKPSINDNEKLDEMLKDWDETHKKINHDFDLDDNYFFNIDGHITKRNSVIDWIKTMPKKMKNWDIIYYDDLIPLYKIFDESLQKEIELLFKDQILMMGSIKIEDKDKKYYRVDFKTPLKKPQN